MTWIRCVCFAYWLALTVGLLHPKGGTLPPFGFGFAGQWVNVAHVLAFGLLAVLVRASRLRWAGLSSPAPLLAYAVLTEVAQVAVPGRTGRLVDVLANVAGIVGGMLIGRLAFGMGDRQHSRRT